MTHFKKFKPFMTYVSQDEHARMKKFAKLKKITMAQMIREAIDSRLSVGDPYTAGYNAGIDAKPKQCGQDAIPVRCFIC